MELEDGQASPSCSLASRMLPSSQLAIELQEGYVLVIDVEDGQLCP